MAESQSRYGIIEELNNRKINVKEKLANIEKETDAKVYDTERAIEGFENTVKEKEASYVREFKDWEREQKLRLKLAENDYMRMKEKREEEIKEKKASYKPNFKAWRDTMIASIKDNKAELERYQKIQNKKIIDKREIIKEIEKGINDLKEVSKESKQE